MSKLLTIIIIIILILNLDLQLLRIFYDVHDEFTGGCLMSEASSWYGFSKVLMPNLQIIIGFKYATSSESKKGLKTFIKFHLTFALYN